MERRCKDCAQVMQPGEELTETRKVFGEYRESRTGVCKRCYELWLDLMRQDKHEEAAQHTNRWRSRQNKAV